MYIINQGHPQQMKLITNYMKRDKITLTKKTKYKNKRNKENIIGLRLTLLFFLVASPFSMLELRNFLNYSVRIKIN